MPSESQIAAQNDLWNNEIGADGGAGDRGLADRWHQPVGHLAEYVCVNASEVKPVSEAARCERCSRRSRLAVVRTIRNRIITYIYPSVENPTIPLSVLRHFAQSRH
jgi:hypothetical protein